MNTKVINAFGGPGAGKTVTCHELVAELKKRGYTAEYVSEYSKDLVYALEGHDPSIPKGTAERLLDGSAASQDAILNEQKRRMDRLVGQVEYVVTDAPVLFNNIYCKEGTPEREQKVRDVWNSYNNMAFFVNRDMNHFEAEGRIHNFEESVQKDKEIRNMLKDMNIEYSDYNHGEIEKLANKIEGKNYIRDNSEYAFRTKSYKNGELTSTYAIFMDADEARVRTSGNWQREDAGLHQNVKMDSVHDEYDNVLSRTDRNAVFTVEDKPYKLSEVRKIEAIRDILNPDEANVIVDMAKENKYGETEKLRFDTTWERAQELVNLENGILRADIGEEKTMDEAHMSNEKEELSVESALKKAFGDNITVSRNGDMVTMKLDYHVDKLMDESRKLLDHQQSLWLEENYKAETYTFLSYDKEALMNAIYSSDIAGRFFENVEEAGEQDRDIPKKLSHQSEAARNLSYEFDNSLQAFKAEIDKVMETEAAKMPELATARYEENVENLTNYFQKLNAELAPKAQDMAEKTDIELPDTVNLSGIPAVICEGKNISLEVKYGMEDSDIAHITYDSAMGTVSFENPLTGKKLSEAEANVASRHLLENKDASEKILDTCRNFSPLQDRSKTQEENFRTGKNESFGDKGAEAESPREMKLEDAMKAAFGSKGIVVSEDGVRFTPNVHLPGYEPKEYAFNNSKDAVKAIEDAKTEIGKTIANIYSKVSGVYARYLTAGVLENFASAGDKFKSISGEMKKEKGTGKKHTNKTRDMLISEFVSALEEEQLPWRQAFSSSRDSVLQNRNASTGTLYRGVNQMTLEAVAQKRGYHSDKWLTFSQMKKMKYSFRKDDKGNTLGKGAGVPIEVFKPYDRSTKKVISFEEYNAIMMGDDDDRKKDLTMFAKNYMVFNGDLINELYKEPEENKGNVEMTPDLERAERVLDRYAANEGIGIVEEPVNCPYYQVLEDDVHMPPRENYEDMREFLQDLSHELGHSTMTEDRLNRNYGNSLEGRAREELVAEIGASFTMGSLEVPPKPEHGLENTKAYVQSWVAFIKDRPEALFEAISKAQKAADFICEKGEREKIFSETKNAQAEKPAEKVEPEKTEPVHEAAKVSIDKEM